MSNKSFEIQKFDISQILNNNSFIYTQSTDDVKQLFAGIDINRPDVFVINEKHTLNDLIERQKTLIKYVEKNMLSGNIDISAHFIMYEYPSELHFLIPTFQELKLSFTIVSSATEIIDQNITNNLKFVILFHDIEDSVLNIIYNQYVKDNMSIKTFKKTYKSCVQDNQSCIILHQDFSTENPIASKIFWFDIE